MSNNSYVYILTNKSNVVLYTGVTNNLARRIFEHKSGLIKGFTKKYKVNKLVYFEDYRSVIDAIAREKQIKAGSREDKIKLVESINKEWEDLCLEIYTHVC